MTVPLFDRMPQAVVFDCDGLLMDTEPCWTVAERAILARRGLPFGTEQKAMVIGMDLAGMAAVLAEVFDEPGTESALAAEVLDAVADVVAERAQAMPGAHELVALVAAAGVPFAVASNSPRVLLDVALDRGGFTGVFPVSIAADEVAAPKPDPQMYLAACTALDVTPAHAVAFEDSMTGLRSARAAGLAIVGVPTLAHDDFPADHVVGSLLDDELVAWVRGWRYS